MAGREGKGKFGIIIGMKRQTIRGTTRRGGIQPRHLVLSSRLGAPPVHDFFPYDLEGRAADQRPCRVNV